MTTSRIGPLPPVPPPLDRAAPARRARSSSRRGGVLLTVALLVLAALPALAGLAGLWHDRGDPYLPIGDHAFLALVVDAVGEHEVLLGAYSRFDWYHPGPMAAYLLAVPYRLLGEALPALSAGTLVINGVSAVVAVWLVRRRAGMVPAVWTVLVLTLSVHVIGADFLRDSWNPYLPVLPFLAGVLLCWTAIRGDAWALPLAVIPLSLAAQSHVGFLPPVGAVGAVLVCGLLLRVVRRRRVAVDATSEASRPARRPRRWLVASVVAVAVGVLLWTPTLVQQVTGTPGNAGVLYDHLLRSSPEQPAGTSVGLRAVADEFGKLPAQVAGADVPEDYLLPGRWPVWAIAVGIGSFVGALAVAAGRRRADALWAGTLTVAVAAAGVAAVSRIEGWAFQYLTQWTAVVGILAWTTVGLGLLPELEGGVRRVLGGRLPGRRADVVLGAPLAALTVLAVAVTAVGTARADTPTTDVTGDVVALERAVVADLERRGLRTGPDAPVVRVDFAPTTRPVIVGTVEPGVGVVLALQRAGIDVQVDDGWRIPFGERYTARPDEAGYVATIAWSDGTSPPAEPWQEVLAVRGAYEVYGGVPPGE